MAVDRDANDSRNFAGPRRWDACGNCGCTDPTGAAMHAVLSALGKEHLDRAIDAGLLDCPLCVSCHACCADGLSMARDNRMSALEARDRYRQRNARLSHRAADRIARRNAVAPSGNMSDASGAPALPSAAAAALARAKAKAAQRRP